MLEALKEWLSTVAEWIWECILKGGWSMILEISEQLLIYAFLFIADGVKLLVDAVMNNAHLNNLMLQIEDYILLVPAPVWQFFWMLEFFTFLSACMVFFPAFFTAKMVIKIARGG